MSTTERVPISSTITETTVAQQAMLLIRNAESPPKLPSFHITAPWGWMNDPCAPGYDQTTGLYHLFYQWNPKGCEWGNMSWGHVVSSDLLRWRRNTNSPVLEPSEPYDKDGVFTGCLLPSGPQGEKEILTAIYSSVCRLPFHWTSPYPRGSAGLAVATSKDKGRTWVKSKRNPIVAEEPANVYVTGFRDPHIAHWNVLDEIRGKESLYGIVAGGIQDHGPTVFFYTVQPQDLSQWEYLGALMALPRNFRPSRKWCGDAGINWECTNFMTLLSGTQSRHFLLTGSEGGVERDHMIKSSRTESLKLPQRTIRWSLWMCVHPILNDDNSISFQYDFGGILDHGCFYAANTFADPLTSRRIVWGWIPEEDVTLKRCQAKGWNGSLSLPREVYHLEILDVVRAWRTPLDELASFELHHEPSGSFTMRTLGIRPLRDLASLRRQTSPSFSLSNCSLPNPVSNSSTSDFSCASSTAESLAPLPVRSTKWELEANIAIHPSCSRVGFHIHHRSDLATRTSIYFSPPDEEMVVDRSESRTVPGRLTEREDDDDLVNTRDERGPHTLFAFASTNENGEPGEIVERLRLHIFRDGSILEVFANDRFALSTMIYIDDEDEATVAGISVFAENGEASCLAAAAVFEDIKVYEMCDSIIDADWS